MASRSETPNHVAIVGASSLRGKELKQVLEDRHFPAADVVLLDETAEAGTLTELAGEPAFIRPLDEDSFEGVRFAFLAGAASGAARNLELAQRAGATVIDLTGTAAARGASTVSIPSLAAALPAKNGPGTSGSFRTGVYDSPSAATIIACTLSAGLAKFMPQRIVALLFPPVSEHGQAGIDELENQTAGLLSFQDVAKPVFDAQVAFNLLSSYGEASKVRLEQMRAAIARDVAYYLAGRAPVPAIQLVQAPLFYGYGFAAYAEFAALESAEQIAAGFTSLGVKVAGKDESAPTNVSVAGESEIHLGRIDPDSNASNGVWLWGAADNLRLAATNAVRIAEELVREALAH